jgi:bifunctional DNA-binding transcriptional regulator/antitoxin component of YhaV-PrlF toxin-antitoxin module
MMMTITAKRQVTFPAHVLASLGAGPGDKLELEASPQGFLLRAKKVDASRLAPLRGKLKVKGAIDMQKFREQAHDLSLRQ